MILRTELAAIGVKLGRQSLASKVILYGILTFLLIAVAESDVRTSNHYYLENSEIVDDVSLKNMDYENSISIYRTGLSGTSKGSTSIATEPSRYEEDIFMSSVESDYGCDLKISAEKIQFGRSFFDTGAGGNFAFEYGLQTGSVKAHYFAPQTKIDENIEISNNMYEGMVWGSGNSLYSEGEGQSVSDNSSYFNHNFNLNYCGKSAETRSFLKSSQAYSGGVPFQYSWAAFAGLFGKMAFDHIAIQAHRGNRIVELGIAGLSDVFPYSQRVPEQPEDYPAILYPGGTVTAENLYMDWQIDLS